MTVFTLTVQNAVDQKLLGVATASSQLFRSVGGTVGVAIMGTLLNSRMQDKMASMSQTGDTNQMAASPELAGKLESLQNPQLLLDHEKLDGLKSTLPQEAIPFFDNVILKLQDSLSYALSGVFIFVTITMAVAILLTFFIKEVPLRSAKDQPSVKKENVIKTGKLQSNEN
jgi:uncharacterized membrane protein YraQ (UPF0718 family)